MPMAILETILLTSVDLVGQTPQIRNLGSDVIFLETVNRDKQLEFRKLRSSILHSFHLVSL